MKSQFKKRKLYYTWSHVDVEGVVFVALLHVFIDPVQLLDERSGDQLRICVCKQDCFYLVVIKFRMGGDCIATGNVSLIG